MTPVLRMRYEHPEQLKQALANDGVANGYQLWYAKNDWRSMLFHYGGSVEGESSKSAKSAPKYSKKGAKLWDYRQALLESNPCSTCRLEVEDVSSISELLTAMGRDSNNQMYPIAWAIVKVENIENWSWFLSLLHDDLNLQQGTGLTLISDSHKGLLDVVGDWLPNAEHRKCTRHVYANFKKKYSGLQLQRLFWGAASSTVEELFYAKMDNLKYINLEAYEYLVARNPNSWCRAFFNLNVKCAAFENGISESYHKAILLQRSKPIITMLEDIRIYIMQRLVAMNKLAVNLEDQITPTVRKRLEYLKKSKEIGMFSLVLMRSWKVHALNPDEGVHFLYSQDVWARTYQHFIRPVPGTNLWKRTNNQPPLPPIVRAMPGRPTKKRIGVAASCKNPSVPKPITIVKKVPSRRREPNVQYASAKGRGRGSRGGGRGAMGAESGGRGQIGAERGDRGQMGAKSGSKGGMGSGIRAIDTDSGDKGGSSGDRATMGGARGRRSGIRERRGGGRGGRRGGGRGSTSGLNLMDEDDIRQSMEDEYLQGLLDKQKDPRQKQEKEHQDKLYEEALQQSREEEFMFERIDLEREREEQQWEAMLDPLNVYRFLDQEESMDVEMYNRTKASINFMVNTQESVTHGQPSSVEAASVQPAQFEPTFAEGLSFQPAPSVPASDNAAKKKGKRTRSEPDVPFRIYHKNRGRSERIRNMQEKKFKFDAQGTRSTAEKAFDVSS
ncbi:splicing factor [Tanacetum coccineum]